MINSLYPYSNGNLLKSPQKYQMTPFLDKNFLDNYQNSRINYLEKISNFEKIDLENLYGICPEKVSVISAGVDTFVPLENILEYKK